MFSTGATTLEAPLVDHDESASGPAAGGNEPVPAAFLGHGSPMNALEQNRYTEAWRTFGATVPRPRAILAADIDHDGQVAAETAGQQAGAGGRGARGLHA